MILRSGLHLAGMALAMIVSTRAPDLGATARPILILIVSEDNVPELGCYAYLSGQPTHVVN